MAQQPEQPQEHKHEHAPAHEREKYETTIVEAGAKDAKKPFPFKLVGVGVILSLVLIGGIWIFGNRAKPSTEAAHTPSAADVAQQKVDTERAARERRQVEGIRDDDFFVRDERAEPSNVQLFRGLNTERPETNYSWEAEQAEEEAINYILHGSKAKAQAQSEAEQSVSETAPNNRATPQPQQHNDNRPATSGNNDDNRMPTPMFVYSRSFGGARFTEGKPGQQAIQNRPVGDKNQDIPFLSDDLMRMALGLVNVPAENAPPDEPVFPVFDVPAMAAADKPTQLIYTAHPPVVVNEGEMLEATLVNRVIVNVEPSPVIAILSRDLFDRSGRYVVFPANSRVIGTAHAVNYRGASRLYISFHRIILPNGLSVDLPQSRRMMRAMDETGAVGIVSHVNRHWMMQFGAAVMLGVFDGIAGYAQRNTQMSTADGMVIGRTSENFGRILDRVMERYSSLMPTISVFQGKTMRIYIADDMVISPYSLISERSYYGTRR